MNSDTLDPHSGPQSSPDAPTMGSNSRGEDLLPASIPQHTSHLRTSIASIQRVARSLPITRKHNDSDLSTLETQMEVLEKAMHEIRTVIHHRRSDAISRKGVHRVRDGAAMNGQALPQAANSQGPGMLSEYSDTTADKVESESVNGVEGPAQTRNEYATVQSVSVLPRAKQREIKTRIDLVASEQRLFKRIRHLTRRVDEAQRPFQSNASRRERNSYPPVVVTFIPSDRSKQGSRNAIRDTMASGNFVDEGFVNEMFPGWRRQVKRSLIVKFEGIGRRRVASLGSFHATVFVHGLQKHFKIKIHVLKGGHLPRNCEMILGKDDCIRLRLFKDLVPRPPLITQADLIEF